MELTNHSRDFANGSRLGCNGTSGLRQNANRAGWVIAYNLQDRSGDSSANAASGRVSVPGGYRPEASAAMALSDGALSAVVEASGTLAGAIAGGLPGASALTGSSSVGALGSLIVSAVAALVGTSGVSSSVRALLLASAALVGSGDLDGATSALGHAFAALAGSGQAAAVADAPGSMSAALVGGAQVGQVEIGASQVTAIAAAVWSAACEGSLDYQAVQRILLAVAAGQTEVDTGGPSPVVTFRDQADTKDRVTATMSGSERVAVVLDPDD